MVRSAAHTVRGARRALAVLGAFVVLVSMAGGTPAQADDAVMPVVDSFGAVDWTPEILRLTATSDSEISSVTVGVISATGSVVLTTSMTPEAEGNGWRTGPMVLALGTYYAGATVTDADGDVTQVSVNWDYLLQPVIQSHHVEATPLSFENRRATISGQVEVYDPRTRTTTANAAAGTLELLVSTPESPVFYSRTLTLSSDGRYSFRYLPRAFGAHTALTVEVRWEGSPGTALQAIKGGAVSDVTGRADVIDRVETSATASVGRIILDKAAQVVVAPGSVTVSAGVMRKVGTEWKPASGSDVAIWAYALVDEGIEGTTDSDGRVTLVGALRSNVPDTRLDLNSTDPYLIVDYTVSKATVSIHQVLKSTLKWGCHTLAATWELHVCSVLDYQHDVALAKSAKIYLQASADGKTKWTSLGYMVASPDTSSGYLKVAHPSWYYRLVFPGTTNLQRSTSAVVRLSRTEARIISTKVTPSTLKKYRKVTVSGTAQKFSGGKYVSVGKGQDVRIYFRKKGTTKNIYKGAAYTSSTGHFSKSFKATADGYWRAVWLTNSKKYVNAYSPSKYVNVT